MRVPKNQRTDRGEVCFQIHFSFNFGLGGSKGSHTYFMVLDKHCEHRFKCCSVNTDAASVILAMYQKNQVSNWL